MASISSLTGSSSSTSIYGTRNVISGLASGLDTETLIENAVAGYKSKIASLQQSQTMVQWKQDAYRSIIDKMVNFNRKYTSYTSSTNLFSQSFFNKAVKTTARGENAAKVTASGRTNSDVKINGVRQLAEAAKYTVDAGASELLSGAAGVIQDKMLTVKGAALELEGDMKVSSFSGSMTLTYGSSSVLLDFDELDAYDSAEELAKGITEKLGDTYVRTGSGDYVKASERIGVEVNGGNITFKDKSGAGNSVYVSSADNSIKDTFGIKPGTDATSISVPGSGLSKEVSTLEYLSGKELNITLDGSSKKVSLERLKNIDKSLQGDELNQKVAEALHEAIADEFGKDKISVSTDGKELSFTVAQGSTMQISADGGEKLGLSSTGLTSYLNTGKSLGELLGDRVKWPEDTKNESGETVTGKLRLTINGQDFEFDKDTTVERMINTINSNKDAGVTLSYSKMTNQFAFTARETGEAGKIDISGDLAGMFGKTKTNYDNEIVLDREQTNGKFIEGRDAVVDVEVNGVEMQMKRASNVIDFDGMSVTLQGTFGEYGEDGSLTEAVDPITFTSESDSDTIIDAIQSFVDDYNAMVTEIRQQYATQPAEKSSSTHERYKPLTDSDKEGMSESAIAAYEEKAKQGILFGQSDLSGLHNALRTAISMNGKDSLALEKMGISTSYQDGLTTISFDQEKMREALASDPDSVRDMFTKTKENGADSDGLMQSIKTVVDTYSNTSIGSPGILVQKAGTTLSSYSLNGNALQEEYDNLTDQIDKWQEKMSDRVDYYTTQFTALEKLMSSMNSQSSMLASLMGGSY